MKSRNLITALLLSVLVCVCVLQQRSIATRAKEIAPAKVAVVNMQKVIVQSKKKKEFDDKYKAYTEKANKEIQELKSEVEAAKEALKVLKRTSSEYEKLGNALMEKETLLEVRQKFYQQAIPMNQQRWIDLAFLSIAKEVQKIAESEGYDLVIAQEGARVLYNSKEIDITDAVLELWDAGK